MASLGAMVLGAIGAHVPALPDGAIVPAPHHGVIVPAPTAGVAALKQIAMLDTIVQMEAV